MYQTGDSNSINTMAFNSCNNTNAMQTRIVERTIVGGKFSIKDSRTVIDFADRTSQFVSDKELNNAIKTACFGESLPLIQLVGCTASWVENYPEKGDTFIVEEGSYLLIAGMPSDTKIVREGKGKTLKAGEYPKKGDVVPYDKYETWRKFGPLSIVLSAAARTQLTYKDDIKAIVLDNIKKDLGIG